MGSYNTKISPLTITCLLFKLKDKIVELSVDY